ncbi:MAG TPA: PGPGW domain-containing protein [Chthoniobacterales bacterium]
MRVEVENAAEDEIAFPGSTHLRRWQQLLTARFGLDRMPVARKVVIGVIGFTVLLLGAVMVVLPGPSIIVIPIGLAILASEFAWARRILRRGSVFVARVRHHRWWRRNR